MTFEKLATASPEAHVYVRPCAFVDSPQRSEAATARLAGTMLWFGAVELTVRVPGADSRTIRLTIGCEDWEKARDALPAPLAERAAQQWNALTRPRAPVKLGERTIRLDQPHVMAILNITPDSFSDGGQHVDDPAAAAEAGFAMLEAGAAIIDIGGESTRPGAKPVWEGDEIARVVPVIERLAAGAAPVSIDTRKAGVMEAALAAGAGMINDVSALLHDERSLAVAAASNAPVVLMHAPSSGDDPHEGAGYHDPALDVFDWLAERIAAAEAAGIARERIIVDPGIGFGKSLGDSLAIVNNLALFHALGCPILFGASRKRVIGALDNEAPADERLGGSVALVTMAVMQGVQLVRVHDVQESVQAIRVWRGTRDAALTARV